jgi:hypothetical protein
MAADVIFVVEAAESGFVLVGVALQPVDTLFHGLTEAWADFEGVERAVVRIRIRVQFELRRSGIGSRWNFGSRNFLRLS